MLVFLDSNVLVYAVDPRDKRKMRIAKDIVSSALRGYRECAISVQTLTEFVNVAVKKLKKPVDEINDYAPCLQTAANTVRNCSRLFVYC